MVSLYQKFMCIRIGKTFERFHHKVTPLDGGNADEVGHDGQMSIPTAGSGNGGSGFGGGEDIRPPLPEHCITVYHNSHDTGAMYGGGAIVGGAGDPTMVGSGRPQFWKRVW